MALFVYEAVDRSGKTVKGQVEASNRDEALAKLRADGYYPTSVKQSKGGASKKEKADNRNAGPASRKTSSFFGIKFSNKKMTEFTRQLATLLDAGLPIVRSLSILEKQCKPGQMKNILQVITDDVSSGTSFSNSIEQHPKTFDTLYVNMVKAGEIGGVLDVILDRLAGFREKSQKLAAKLKSAMIYPCVILVVIVLILTFVMIFIIPKFQDVFKSMDVDMPYITSLLMNFSENVKSNWHFGVLGIVMVFATYQLVRATKGGRYFTDNVKLRLPLIGQIMNKTAISRFCRTLGTLTSSGVPILDALNIIKDATGNDVISKAVYHVMEGIREGETIAEPMRATSVFDDMVVNMVSVGEETGELDKMLIKIADNYEYEVDTQVEGLSSALEPVMILFMGVAVGFIVVALFMPLLSLISQF